MAVNLLTYGFTKLSHLAAERVTTVGESAIYTAIGESAREHTRQLNAVLSSLASRTTKFKERFYIDADGTLQPITEDSSPDPVRESGYFDVAYPIQGGGTAWGSNRVSRAKMTVDEANRLTLAAVRRDGDWMIRHALAALFTNTTWSYSDREHGTLTIQPLAIAGDGVQYNLIGGTKATDTHHLAQASGIADASNPFPTIYNELVEHPGNDGPVVVFVPTNLKDDIEALTDFVPVSDPEIQVGIASDRIAANASALASIMGPGNEVLGRVNKCWAVEWRRLPDNYMIAHASSAEPALAMREHEEAQLQGFFPENDSGDGNLTKAKMIRYAGFGVRNRIAAVVMRIGNGSYAIPTGYTAPLPV